jgi:hypothetical protein
MDGGKSASLIGADQVAGACNCTFRGGFLHPRSSFFNWTQRITFQDAHTKANWTGQWQGCETYASDDGTGDGWVIARGGHIFFLSSASFLLREITPQLKITTLETKAAVGTDTSFNVPSPGVTTQIPVQDESLLVVGQSFWVDSGQYTVISKSSGLVVAMYVGFAKNQTCSIGVKVVNSSFTVPSAGDNVDVPIIPNEASAGLAFGATLTIDSGTYTVFQNNVDYLTLTYVGGAAHTTVLPTAWIINSSNQTVTYTDESTTNILTYTALSESGKNSLPISFYVPLPNGYVNVPLSGSHPFTIGETIFIGTGSYVVKSVLSNELVIEYLTGDLPGNAIPAGTQVLDSNSNPIVYSETYPAYYDFVFMFQAENYMIILGGQHATLIFDGSSTRIAGVDELPPAVLGAYGWGRIWLCLNDRKSFVAGDIVGGSSGTAAYNGRDAILKMTENDYLNEGGNFGVPNNAGPITAMQFLATQDTSLGVGVLLISTTNMVFSVNAPTDRTTWKSLTYPIQTVSLLDYGPQGPRNAIPVNGDMWYRSSDGFRSFIVARRNFGQPGNTPISREVSPLLEQDTADLLFYGSGVLFDNRLLSTVSPLRTPLGVSHRGLVSINFDLISDLRQKGSPAWEGAWTGLNILQIVKAQINSVERAFVFAAGEDIELWEILPKGYYDQDSPAITPLQSWVNTRSHSYNSPFQLKRLHMGELFLDEIVDQVSVTVKWRPDQYPTWTTWGIVHACAPVSQCEILKASGATGKCAVWKTKAKQYATRLTLPQPPDVANPIPNMPPLRDGHEFQFRLEITGSCRVRAFRTHATPQTEPQEGQYQAVTKCVVVEQCDDGYFGFDSHNTSGLRGVGGEFILGVGGENILPVSAGDASQSGVPTPNPDAYAIGVALVNGVPSAYPKPEAEEGDTFGPVPDDKGGQWMLTIHFINGNPTITYIPL